MIEQTSQATIAIAGNDYLQFVGRAVRGMAAIADQLGDDLANVRANVPGANTAYGLLTHCLGVVEFWSGHLMTGRDVDRDRLAEFESTGPVAPLLARTDAVLAQLAVDVRLCRSAEPLAIPPPDWAMGPDMPLDQAAALLHVYEEVSQHFGQLQVLRDVLVAAQANAS